MTKSPKVLYWLGLSVLLSGPVRAGDGGGSPTRPDTTAVSAPPGGESVPGMKSGKTALLLSVLGTVVPAAATLPFIWERSGTSLAKTTAIVGTGAYLLGPSLGHFYSGRPGRAFAGIGLRALAAAGVVVAGFASSSEAGANSGQAAIGVAGAVVGGASVIYDIASAPHSAQIHNDEMRRGMHATFGIVPVDGLRGIGIRASVAF